MISIRFLAERLGFLERIRLVMRRWVCQPPATG